MSEAADAPVCPRHPGTTAYVRCQRCDRPTCPACQRPAPVGVQCVDCVKEAQRAARPVVSRLGFAVAGGPPVVTYTLIGLNVAFYLFGMATGLREWQVQWGMIPALTFDEPWRVVTATFVHAGIIHLGINMWVLYQFGTMLERGIGRVPLVVLYSAAGLGSSAAIQFLAAEGSLHVGASGAVFGLIAGLAFALRKLRLPYQQIAIVAGLWLVAGFFISGISWQGHLGGAVVGTAVILTMLGLVERRTSPRRD